MAKATDTRSASSAKAATRRTRSAAETDKIQVALVERRDELQGEYDQHLAEITELQRDRLTDSAGDDQAVLILDAELRKEAVAILDAVGSGAGNRSTATATAASTWPASPGSTTRWNSRARLRSMPSSS